MNMSAYLTLFVAAMSGFIAGFSYATWLRRVRNASEDPLLETLLRLRYLEELAQQSECENDEVNHYLSEARTHFEQALGARHFPMGEQHYYKRAVCSFHVQNAGNLLTLAEGIIKNSHSCEHR